MIPRSLADAMRQRDDAWLTALLTARPDLAHPAPSDFTALAARATTGPSVSRCLDGLTELDLFTLATAARVTAQEAAGPEAISAAVLAQVPGLDAAAVAGSITRLLDVALLWGAADALRAIHPVRDALTDAPPPRWPMPELTGTIVADPDALGGVHAHEVIALVREIGDRWSVRPPGVTRGGGLAIRDLAQTLRDVNVDAPAAALAIELAVASGLIADDGEADPCWVPTDAYDPWLEAPAAEQWLGLVRAWLGLSRLPSEATERTSLLSTDLDRRSVVGLRAAALRLIAEAPATTTIDAATLQAVLNARTPRRAGALRDAVVVATLAEGDALGVLAGGALTSAGRAIINGDVRAAKRAMAAAMPAEIDHVLIQADLTVIAPGPLTAQAARSLRMLADVESRGHATVFRISAGSLQRAIDAGWDAAQITAALESVSRTGIPQPLAYLIDDAARRHGAVRVGIAAAYIRCADEALLAAILADRRLRALGLTRLGEQAVASQATPAQLIEALRAAGYAPAAESPAGEVVMAPTRPNRTAAPRHRAVRQAASPGHVAATIRGLRATRSARAALPAAPELAPATSATVVATLRTAIAETAPVWIAYADADGTTTEQIIDPIRLGGGSVTAFDHRTEQVRTFAVARISGLAPVES